ncbi:PAS domain-containing protein [Dongia sp.]|uniref:PAS domain-containing protein n=1 Tax=Dongia sp. TaxID=1977262 RepID=UPI0035AF0F8A
MMSGTDPFPEFSPSLTEITSPRIRGLLTYWQKKCAGRAMPAREDIDPSEIRDLLPNIVMVDIEQPFRVRYRLVGTRVADFNRIDFTGRYLDELRWDGQGRYSRAYRYACEHGVPIYGIDTWPLAHDHAGRSEIGIMPLSPDGKNVDRCLAIEDFLFPEHQLLRREYLDTKNDR